MVAVLTCPTSYARSGYASRICRTKVLKAFGPTIGLLGIQMASCRSSRELQLHLLYEPELMTTLSAKCWFAVLLQAMPMALHNIPYIYIYITGAAVQLGVSAATSI
jgi:hypothetical protein